MQAKLVLTALAIIGGLAMAAPSFAQDRSYGDGMRPGSLGMDAAPGGGTYTRQDAASEAPDRMSHPVPGERRAPSNVARGPLGHVDRVERDMTANLNRQQLNGGGDMQATLPNDE
ncbi:MAG TPA: hypothetical protein VIJ42_16030 [Stellaceae bacterium]